MTKGMMLDASAPSALAAREVTLPLSTQADTASSTLLPPRVVPPVRRLAILGNYLPRHCGIATFTSDLSDALAAASPRLETFVVAMNDHGTKHDYPDRVRFGITEGELGGYRRAANYVNASGAEVLSVQHEYGIYGGDAGAHVLAFLREIRVPIVTTLHTILVAPSAAQRQAMDELCALAARLVVMSARGAELLAQVHGVASDKIVCIPHGIARVATGNGAKERLGLTGRQVLLTFGLLSPDKGIEYAIEALPDILAQFPNTLYLVVGSTHPHVKAEHGESYRESLVARARDLGIASSVRFEDRFVSREELADFLSATDVYLTPYLNMEQITSGTLAFAMGNGRAVISTPYRYARELLADGRGILVPRADHTAIAREAIALFGDDERRQSMRRRASNFGRDMMWPSVASSYLECFAQTRAERIADRGLWLGAQRELAPGRGLPEFTLAHVNTLTDDTGIVQHANYSTPRRSEGYCVDDNARALLVVSRVSEIGLEPTGVSHLVSCYLGFLYHAFDRAIGRFRNFMSYDRQWLETVGSEDCHGRVVWALGTHVSRATDPGQNTLARNLFHEALGTVVGFTSPRSWAYVLLGIAEYATTYGGDRGIADVQELLANKLLARFHQSSSANWPWYEDRLTYSNARLAQAMLRAGEQLAHPEMVEVALRSLTWLCQQQIANGYFTPIGSNGFYPRGGRRAQFDQQPVEACGTVSAALDALRVTNNPDWGVHARRAFDWFLGHNHLHLSLYDPATGGCRDGLHADRVNQNQGAESTLSFLQAHLELLAVECGGTTLKRALGSVRI